MSVSILDFGGDPSGAVDNSSALLAAIAAVSANPTLYNEGGPTIYFPPGLYYFGAAIELKKTVALVGESMGQSGGYATKFVFPADCHGIIVHRYNTIGGSVESPATRGGDASLIRGIELRGSLSGTTGHGIWLRGRAKIENVRISHFKENGVNIVASAGVGGSGEGNANCWRADTVCVTNCGGHGFFADGADANAGTAVSLDCRANGGWAIYDSSFLGNTYIGCHASSNGLGPYKSDNANARNVFLGCYSEGGQPASDVMAPAVVVGGLHGAGFTEGSTAFRIFASTAYGRLSPFEVEAVPGSGNAFMASFCRAINEAVSLEAVGDGPGGFSPLTWDAGSGCWVTRHRRAGARTPAHYTTDLNTLTGGRSAPLGGGKVMFTQGVWVGSSAGAARFIGSGTAAPTAGEWAKGDRINNTNPSPGSYAGWICTTAGTPGTWKGFGAIEP